MGTFPHTVRLGEDQVLEQHSTEKITVGTRGMAEDGRVYRFCENGGVALIVANMVQSEVPVADGLNEVVDAMAAGATVLTGVGATTNDIAVNALKEGYCFSLTAADTNPCYRIKSNTLLDAGQATGTITLYTPLQAAIAAASTISVCKNPWRDIIAMVATTPTAFVCGVAIKALALDTFGWVLTRGVARVLTGGTGTVIGDPIGPGDATGSVDLVAALVQDVPFLGHTVVAGAATEMGLYFINIDGGVD